MRNHNNPAMVAAPAVAVGAPAITGAVMCAVSLVASAQPLRIQLPKLPKLPEFNIDLPNFGQKKSASAPSARKPAVTGAGKVKVRAAKGVVPTADAPTLAEVSGQATQDSIKAGAGYKKFPERRMPGANMEGWKKIAKDITPEV